MEGACVYIDNNNFSTLFMYKEIKDKLILYVKYNFITFDIKYISIFDFFYILPDNNIHILSSLPYINDLNLTLDVWRNMALNKLNSLNKVDKINNSNINSNIYSNNNFNNVIF